MDPTTHFWYKGLGGELFRLCDDAKWVNGTQPVDNKRPYVPCRSCQELYADDLVIEKQLLDPLPSSPGNQLVPSHTPNPVEYSHLEGVAIPRNGVSKTMMNHPVALATFARFYGATGPQKVTMVRDARLFITDPKGYACRDYYRDFRNTLRKTHWQTNDIGTFEAALEPLVSQQTKQNKQEHYRKLGEAYIKYWKKHDAHFFDILPSSIEIAELTIRISLEVGMSYHGDNLALKLWLPAPRPTRSFRQVVQYLTTKNEYPGWRQDWQMALWDVRREEVLPPVPIPRDFALAVEGQAMAFQQIWQSLGEL